MREPTNRASCVWGHFRRIQGTRRAYSAPTACLWSTGGLARRIAGRAGPLEHGTAGQRVKGVSPDAREVVETDLMKELRKSIRSPADLLDMTCEELAQGLLLSMQQRQHHLVERVNRESAVSELFSLTDPISPMEQRRLEARLEPAFRKAFDQLERWELIEPEAGVNGKNGYVVLTEEGAESDAHVDFENLRQRRLLLPEMLHSKLRGDVHADFLAGKFGRAVFGAFKIVEMEVRRAADLNERDHGAQLMQIAFNEKNGPLTDPAESPTQQKALRLLFEGSLGRFRNPEGHADRTFVDPMEPMQELMLASRLLRLLDGRPVPGPKATPRKR